MAAQRDFVLAELANLAYQDAPTGLPVNFTPLSATALAPSLTGSETYVNGVFHNQNAAAMVSSGYLDGKLTVALAFRGSDDRTDSINDLRNINTDFPKFAELITAVEAFAIAHGAQVAYTGHSLGGSMAQLAIAAASTTDGVTHLADTFGSAGALQAGGGDARVTNFVIADDPAVWLGENRAEIGAQLNGNVVLSNLAAVLAQGAFPGLSFQDALDSVPYLTQDYVNRGINVALPDAHGNTAATLSAFSLAASLLSADPSEHKPALYVQKLLDATPHFVPGAGAEPLFDKVYYRNHQPDVLAAGVDPQSHYDTNGWHEGRDPNPLFSVSRYLASNADVVAAKLNPLQHYESFGWHEGRNPDAVFLVNYYLGQNPDVAAAGAEPLLHYELYGWKEGRNPDPFFDVHYYLANNPDVATASIDPLAHYEEYGWKEGRNPGPGFNTASYLAHNPDVAAAHMNPLDHYLLYGIAEHRLL